MASIIAIILIPIKMVELQERTDDAQTARMFELERALISWSLLFLAAVLALIATSIQLALAMSPPGNAGGHH
jgi:hypothetical protein